jgi:hypothetical protein
MKIKQTIVILSGLLLAVNVFAQAKLTFANTSAKAVIDSRTGAAVAAGVAKAGLYFSTDLGAIANPDAATDSFQLAIQFLGTTQIPAGAPAVVPIGATLAGVFLGGQVTVTGIADPTAVLVQVRAWSSQYNTYAEAFNANAYVGHSNVMNIQLVTGTTPPNSTSGPIVSFTISPVPEPSTVLLGLLGGLGAMVLLRRRS